jgi:uncharacterized protein (DUF433 family)/DNA-binding transcriptional MerR regulator
MDNESVRELPSRGRYLAHEVGRLAGVSGTTVGQWARRGFIRSSQSTRTPRVYSFQDIAEAMVVHELLERGVEHSQIKRAIQSLRERYGHDWPLTHAMLATAAGRIITEADDAIYDVGQRGWQQVNLDERDLERIVGELQRGGWAVRSRPGLTHIEVNPDRLSGRPVVRGTRVPVEVAAELAEEPGGRDALREGYGLTDPEIEDARAWWAATREYETAAA